MDESKKGAFGVVISAMLETFGQEATKARLLGYWLGMRDLELGQVEEAVGRSLQTATRLPAPAELRELVLGGSGQDRAMAAWGDVLKAIAEGPYRHVDFEDKLINAAIRLLGGWPSFLGRFEEAESEKWARLDFVKMYGSLVSSGVNGDACRPLAGLSVAEASGGIHEPVPRRIGCDETRKRLPCEVRHVTEKRGESAMPRLELQKP